MPIMIIDNDNTVSRLPIEYFNEYMDMGLMMTSNGHLFTPTPLQDPEKFMYGLLPEQKSVIHTIKAYTDIRSVCYGAEGAYLFPIDSGVNVGVINTRSGTMELRRDGTLFLPKYSVPNIARPFDIDEYSECVNGKCDRDIKNLLDRILQWVHIDYISAYEYFNCSSNK